MMRDTAASAARLTKFYAELSPSLDSILSIAPRNAHLIMSLLVYVTMRRDRASKCDRAARRSAAVTNAVWSAHDSAVDREGSRS